MHITEFLGVMVGLKTKWIGANFVRVDPARWVLGEEYQPWGRL